MANSINEEENMDGRMDTRQVRDDSTDGPHTTEIISPHTTETISPHTTEIISPHTAQIISPHTTEIISPHTTEILSPHTTEIRPHTAEVRQRTTEIISPHTTEVRPHTTEINPHSTETSQHTTATSPQFEPGNSQVMGMQQELRRHRFLRTPKMRRILQEFSFGLGLSKRRTVLKDFAVLCIASLFGALGSLPLHTIQTTINCPAALGYFSLSVLYASFALAIGCASLVTRISQLSPKILLLGAMTSQVVFISANNYPSYSTLLPASVLSGIGHGILWHVQITLVSSLALKYSALNYESNTYHGRTFRAIFVLTYEVAFIIGNLYSSIIFYNFMNKGSNFENHNETVPISVLWDNLHGTNITDTNVSTSSNETLCLNWHSYVFDCDPSNSWPENFKTLFSTYSIFIVTGFLTVLIFLNSPDVVLQRSSPSSESLWSQTKSTWNSCRISIVFCCCFTGIQQAFVFGDMTKFIGSNLGLPMVGVGMAYYGLSRLPWLLIANSRLQEAIANPKKLWILGVLCYLISMLAYILTGVFISVQSVGLLQFLMPVWGIMEGLNEQIISGLNHKTSPGGVVGGMMYPCFHSVGMAIGSTMAPFICPMVRIQAQLAVLTISLLGAVVMIPCLRKGTEILNQPTDV